MKIGSGVNPQTANMINQNKTNTDAILSKIGATRELSGKDNASLVISNSLASQISTLGQSIQNANETVGMYQIADTSLQAIQAGSDVLNDLSVRFNSDTLNESQKNSLKQEFADIAKSMQTMVDQTSYNGQNILSNAFGLNVSGISDMSIDNQESITSFTQNLTSLSSTVGSQMNSAQVSIANSLSAMSNLSSANASISEQPMDQKISNLATEQVKLDSSLMVQAHQNTLMQQRVAALLG
jgi:flagellin